mgnify:FL=1
MGTIIYNLAALPGVTAVGILLAFITKSDEETDKFIDSNPITINTSAWVLSLGFYTLLANLLGLL